MGSWGLQRQARVAPCLGAATEIDDVLDAERHGHLRSHRRTLAHGAHEDRAVAKLLSRRVGQQRVEHDMSGSGHMTFVPFPVFTHVDDVVALVDQLLDFIELQVAKSRLLIRHSLSYSSSRSLPANP